MTTIYVPHLIESAEQAEALPVGSVALDSSEDGNATDAYVKVRANHWYFTTIESDWLTDAEAVGLMHLVPIQVEVEQIRESDGRRRSKTLYVTPWSMPSTEELGGAALAEGGGPR